MEFAMYKSPKNVDDILQTSRDRVVLVFKHSNSCPISYNAKTEVDSFIEKNKNNSVYLVVVQENRTFSNELAEKLGVKHESPQLLVINDSKAERVLNHYDITRENIEKSLTS